MWPKLFVLLPRNPILDFAMIIASISIMNTTNTINTIPMNYEL